MKKSTSAKGEKMLRQIIKIDEEKCNGCGLCATACHEGAIQMINGKAKLIRDDYCDGLGDCLPGCPTQAIRFETREASAYDEQAVQENQNKKQKEQSCSHQGCCSTQPALLSHDSSSLAKAQTDYSCCSSRESQLMQWPVQIKLVPTNAPYFQDAHLLIAADCCAYAHGNFHEEFMKNKIVLIGCPKLDEGDYTEKLTSIIQHNSIKSITVTRMEVPCCSGLERAAINAMQQSGKFLPWQVITIRSDGTIKES